jgi:transposase
MDKKTRRKYSSEFKREAVELASQPGQTIVGVAADLGIGASLIQRWKRELCQLGQQAFVGQGVARDEELMTLRRELVRVKKERDFLKSAAVYFAKDSK